MVDASLPADQSGLSDLSAASMASVGPYVGERSPSPKLEELTSKTAMHLSTTTTEPVYIRAGTPVLSSSRASDAATYSSSPGPSRFGVEHNDKSGAAWTPSPDASSSRPSANKRSTHRSSPAHKNANESMGSSLGTFDLSNASFSESFLRQAGAHMLAGLDEAELPRVTSSSPSPSYRPSSSPTVTVKPGPADPRTPFTGKSLRTRMMEAGMLDSPASSDGSSPSHSPTARMYSGSFTNASQAEKDQGSTEGKHMQPLSDSLHTERSTARYAEYPQTEQGKGAEVPLHTDGLQNSGDVGDLHSIRQKEEWQEGLSVVLEESYVGNSYRVSPSSKALAGNITNIPSPLPISNVGSRSVPSDTPTSLDEAQVASPMLTPSRPEHAPHQPASPELKSEQMSPSATRTQSPQSPLTGPSTPQSAPRATNTPKSFARLRMMTPARSSPLSHVVNFSPSSNGSETRWQSPVSERNVTETQTSSPKWEAEQGLKSGLSATVTQQSSIQTPEQRRSSHESAAVTKATEGQQSFRETPVAEKMSATPLRFWSPSMSNGFATPSSERASVPCTPASANGETPASPVADFGTPQWSPKSVQDAIPIAADEDAKAKRDAPVELDSPSLSSASSSASETKQCGDISLASISSQPHSSSGSRKFQSSLGSPAQHLESPSAERCSRMQLSRFEPKVNASSGLALSLTSSVPELAQVASAFDSLTHLTDDRVARLLTQLSASTARVEELEAALEARDHEREEHDKLRCTLSQLSSQYEELIREADQKDLEMTELVEKLQAQLASRSTEAKTQELERELEEERRLREVQRRDYEVRIQALLIPADAAMRASSQTETGLGSSTTDCGLVPQTAVETAKEQLRLSLEKDFQVRRSIEQRELQTRIEQLELQLASAAAGTAPAAPTAADLSQTSDKDDRSELQRQLDELTSELDRRLEELADMREQLDTVTCQKERVEDRAGALEEELATVHHHGTSEATDRVDELERELEIVGTRLAEKESEIDRLTETLTLTSTRLSALTADHTALQTRTAALESQLVSLQTQPRAPLPPLSPSTSATPTTDRTAQLERQIAHLNLELVKLRKAHDALHEDNVNFSIALSAKQLELGMVKRNARFALKSNSQPGQIGQPPSQVQFPKVPTTSLAYPDAKMRTPVEVDKVQPVVNQARAHARELLAQRKALDPKPASGAGAGAGESRQQLALAA